MSLSSLVFAVDPCDAAKCMRSGLYGFFLYSLLVYKMVAIFCPEELASYCRLAHCENKFILVILT